MIIQKIEHSKRMNCKSYSDGYLEGKMHMEVHHITTWWFLFIPIYRSMKLTDSTL
jgi:hypothetical protein